MSEVTKIIDQIENERAKIRDDLKRLTMHFERLGKIMEEKEKRHSYLRCKANMRTLSAMIRGLSTMSFGMILQDEREAVEAKAEAESKARTKKAKKGRENRVAKRAKRAKETATSKEAIETK
jgi:hypothetical protein